MQQEDSRKAILDSFTLKEKIDKLKSEMHELKKNLKKLENFECLYEDLKAKDSER